ncbi:hypothetical protein F0U60_13175 [Archangium minus]|uniref:Zinc finger/thioredoxin putative domain-containing protein n=1 Tax=Archangium minus TaxID=83450 RepID=A0ABY9WM92_9BACT|nr:hypothetical protein F0U60_13175 [Archangium minus]
MIVKCERCQTRFKIPDEKVTDKGVKVRCTKCQHTFRVVREDVASATPAPATPRSGTPLEVPRTSGPGAAPAGKAPAPGVAAARGGLPAGVPRVSSTEPPKTPATIDLDPLMEFIGESTPTPAEALKLAAKAPIPNKPAGAVAVGPVQPSAPVQVPARSHPLAPKPAQGAAPLQVPAKSPPVPLPVPAKSPAPAPVSSAPFSFDENNPFGSDDSEATLAGSMPTLPPAPAPKPVPVSVPARSAPPAPKPAQSAAPAPVQVPARSPAPAPAPQVSAPMAFEENDPFSLPPEDAPTLQSTPTLPPRGAAPVQPRGAPMAFEENDPFSLPPENAPTLQATPTLPPRGAAPAPAPTPAPVFEEMEGLEGNNPFVSFDPVAALPPAPAKSPAPAPVSTPAASPGGMGGFEDNNPFAAFDPVAALPPAPAKAPPAKPPAPAPAASPAPASAIPDWGAPQQSAPSGIPDWGAPQQSMPSGIPDWGATQTVAATPTAKANAPTERNPFPDFPGAGAQSTEILPDIPGMMPAPSPPVIAAPPPAPKLEAPKAPPPAGPSLVQRLAAVAAQLVVGAVLLVVLLAVGSAWLNDGRVELSALSPAQVREMVSPTRPLVAKDLSNGLYETRGGRAVFFVRGEVENRGTAPIRVKVGVSLFDGDQKVMSAEGIAGAVPTPEELYSLQSASDADAMRARLDDASKEVAPGTRAPFVVLFYEYPSDLADFRLEVTLEPRTTVAAREGAQEGRAGNAKP